MGPQAVVGTCPENRDDKPWPGVYRYNWVRYNRYICTDIPTEYINIYIYAAALYIHTYIYIYVYDSMYMYMTQYI